MIKFCCKHGGIVIGLVWLGLNCIYFLYNPLQSLLERFLGVGGLYKIGNNAQLSFQLS